MATKRKRNKSVKGGNYEREVCRDLSKWMTDGEHDDLFWRSSTSGARATVRGRQGKRTAGHAGDISPCNAAGMELTDRITIEIKRGYNAKCRMGDLLEKRWPTTPDKSSIFGFIEQAERAARVAGTKHWMLIHKPDGRNSILYMTDTLFDKLEIDSGIMDWIEVSIGGRCLMVIRFDEFLMYAEPENVRLLPKGKKK